MYAPHYAVALAVSRYSRRAPLSALLVGAFLPDLVWIVLARIGVEPADAVNFFDDWSHSLFSAALLATVFALSFRRRGRAAMAGLWLTVFSHFVLDFPLHPKPIAAYPMSRLHIGSMAWSAWGAQPGWLSAINDWWFQLLALLVFLGVYTVGARRDVPWKIVAASWVALLGVHLVTLAPCVGY